MRKFDIVVIISVVLYLLFTMWMFFIGSTVKILVWFIDHRWAIGVYLIWWAFSFVFGLITCSRMVRVKSWIMIYRVILWTVVMNIYPLWFSLISIYCVSVGYDPLLPQFSPFMEGYILGWCITLPVGALFLLIMWLSRKINT